MFALYLFTAVVLLMGFFTAVGTISTFSTGATRPPKIARTKSLSKEDQQESLEEAREALRHAIWNYSYVHRLWTQYQWGYRNNPYFIPRFVAQLEWSRLNSLVENLNKALSVDDDQKALVFAA